MCGLQIVYRSLRGLLFLLPPELAHILTLNSLRQMQRFGLLSRKHYPPNPITLCGINFPNRVGLAAGLDKNGDYIDALLSLGFGFIEVGAVTPKPQPGNPKPRLFRLRKASAMINRLGFNNKGVDYLVRRLQERKVPGVIGVNLGKNLTTAIENASQDYEICFEKVYPYVDYATINISSPNTPRLRELQTVDYLHELLHQLKAKQTQLAQQHQRHVPLFLKISPDLSSAEIQDVVNAALAAQIEAIVATNTTQHRAGVQGLAHADEAGGLSGEPLFGLTLRVVKQLHTLLGGQIPIIAVGGITSAARAQEMFNSGAELVQIYTGFIYEGPALLQAIAKINANKPL